MSRWEGRVPFLEFRPFGYTQNLLLGLSCPQQNRKVAVKIPAVWSLPWSAGFPFKGWAQSEVPTGLCRACPGHVSNAPR